MDRYFWALDFFVALVVLALIVDVIGNLIMRTKCGHQFYVWLFGEDSEYDD